MISHTIDILLSTFNGAIYLEELFDSLLNQSYSDFRIVVRDDNSKDSTVEIIASYVQRFPTKIYFIENNNENIGTIKSFETLLLCSTAKYIMFCDQDDVWLPNKIEITFNKMKEIELQYSNSPVLIHTDLRVVDKNLNEINPSFWNFTHTNPDLLSSFDYLGVFNGITGCTCMINLKAKQFCLPFSNLALMHDSWLALIISKTGYISYVDESTILYRQHEMNQVGAQFSANLKSYLINRFLIINKVVVNNVNQIRLLNSLNYGGVLKYLKFKFLYFIKIRI